MPRAGADSPCLTRTERFSRPAVVSVVRNGLAEAASCGSTSASGSQRDVDDEGVDAEVPMLQLLLNVDQVASRSTVHPSLSGSIAEAARRLHATD